MDPKEILKFCIERGLLIEPEVLSLLSEVSEDTESVKLIIEKIRSHTQRRILTKNLFEQNKEQVKEFFLSLPQENQKSLEKLKIKLGLEIEISRVSHEATPVHLEYTKQEEQNQEEDVKILSKPVWIKKKVEVEDFVKNLRHRLLEMKNI